MLKLKTRLKSEAIIGYDKAFKLYPFLVNINCFLKDYVTADKKRADNIINAYCSQFGINQRMIVVTLQREQGLLNHKTIDTVKPYYKWLIIKTDGKQRAVNVPNKKQSPKLEPGEIIKDQIQMELIDWACGYGVPDDGVNMAFKGFEEQVKGACKIYRSHYLTWKPGLQKELVPPDKEKWCEPENAETYSLLMFTPHQSVLKKNEDYYNQYFPGYTV